jgi:hypothetical protein
MKNQKEVKAHHGYFVALFDILGFEHKLKQYGLNRMHAAYEALIEKVLRQNRNMDRVFGEYKFAESPHWTAEGEIFIFSIVRGAYASDSILLWANRTWPEARVKSAEELQELATDPAHAWVAQPIPCDPFLDTCNELVCHGLETGLPLRGAVSMGDAVFDEEKRIFLGQPMIDVARMEKAQRLIGASTCRPFSNQVIPKRYLLKFDKHLKRPKANEWGGFVLDWPRHWRNTRSALAAQAVQSLNTDTNFASYYENTLRFIDVSMSFASQFQSSADISIREQYPEFSYANKELAVKARPVRRIPIKQ